MTFLQRAAVAAVMLAAPVAAEELANGGFEAPPIGSLPGNLGSYAYINGDAGLWTFLGGAGLINGVTGSPWFGGSPPQGFGGSQYAFLQSSSSLQQSFIAQSSGLFTLSWLEAARPLIGGSAGNQNYTVHLDGTLLGSFSTVSGQAFTARSAAIVPVSAGIAYTLTFTGSAPGDNTAFIDNISGSIAAAPGVPEPDGWLLMMGGFGGIGLVARRHRRGTRIVTA
ncbi:hypothetical protein CAP39_05275 [Sphingomonas sp. IBVSS1]|nr:hypothetical protein CAP39_05275 [Sphingomonas sp. IBVSS1]